MALSAHVQSEWWPVMFLMVFKEGFTAARHPGIFFDEESRMPKVLATPQRMMFESIEMTDEEKDPPASRLDAAIMRHRSYIAKNIYEHNRAAAISMIITRFSRTGFARDGFGGIEQVIKDAAAEQQQLIPPGLSVDQYLQLATALCRGEELREPRKGRLFPGAG